MATPRLLVLLLCLCKSFKELSLDRLPSGGPEAVCSKAGAKVRTFGEPTKFSRKKIHEKYENQANLDLGQGKKGQHLILIIGTGSARTGPGGKTARHTGGGGEKEGRATDPGGKTIY